MKIFDVCYVKCNVYNSCFVRAKNEKKALEYLVSLDGRNSNIVNIKEVAEIGEEDRRKGKPILTAK